MNRSVEKWLVGHMALARKKMKDARLVDSWGRGRALREPQREAVQLFCGLDTLRTMLLYWDTGTGKTFTAVAAMHYLCTTDARWRFLILVPASLTDIWNSALERVFNVYPPMRDRTRLVRYNNDTPMLSFNNQYNGIVQNNRNRLCIVIDEVHNFVTRSMPKADGRPRDQLYTHIMGIASNPNNKLLLLTATPIRNTVREFNYLLHLMRPTSVELGERLLNHASELNDREGLKMRIYGLVSYNSITETGDLFQHFAQTEDFAQRDLFIVPLTMSQRQSDMYDRVAASEAPNASNNTFKTNRRIFSSAAVDSSALGGDDPATRAVVARHRHLIESLHFSEGVDFSRVDLSEPSLPNPHDSAILDTLMGYSVKFTYSCLQMKTQPGKFLVYQFFVNNGGIDFYTAFLRLFGISFIEFSSRTVATRRAELKRYNSPENDDASLIKVCIFSDSGNEGVSYLSVRSLVVMDLPWSYADLEQIVGRGHRLRSHSTLPEQDRILNVYIYIASTVRGASLDREMEDIIRRKQKANNKILKCMKECSFEWLAEQYPVVPAVESEFVFDTLRRPPKPARSVTTTTEKTHVTEITFKFVNSDTIRSGELAPDGRVYEEGACVGAVALRSNGAYMIEPTKEGPVYIVHFDPGDSYIK